MEQKNRLQKRRFPKTEPDMKDVFYAFRVGAQSSYMWGNSAKTIRI